MKLVQSMSPSRTYLGVTFPLGVPVQLPDGYPADAVTDLLSWGWQALPDDPAPQPVAEPDQPQRFARGRTAQAVRDAAAAEEQE
jgi:hypothetical protein